MFHVLFNITFAYYCNLIFEFVSKTSVTIFLYMRFSTINTFCFALCTNTKLASSRNMQLMRFTMYVSYLIVVCDKFQTNAWEGIKRTSLLSCFINVWEWIKRTSLLSCSINVWEGIQRTSLLSCFINVWEEITRTFLLSCFINVWEGIKRTWGKFVRRVLIYFELRYLTLFVSIF